MGFIKFIGARIIEATICFVLITLLPLPPYMEFTAYSIPPYMPLEGTLKLNDRLNNAEHLFVDLLKGPESFAVYNGEIYTGIHGGEVVKIVNKSLVHVAKFGKPCDGYWEESICGRPLGLKFDKHGNLYVADTYYGVFKVNVDTGLVTKLVSPDIPIDGKKPLLINSIDVADDGTIYWSHSSSDVTLQDGVYTLFGDGSGRLLKYSPTTNTSEVLLDKLFFANGVLLSEKEDFVLVSETHGARIRRYYLKGEKKGTSDIFVDKLPGLPDNLSHDGKGGYFVPLVFPADNDHPAIHHIISGYPVLRKFLVRLLTLMEMPFHFIERFYSNYYSKRATHWVPCKKEEWIPISNGFQHGWNFPGCCGATDEKHVQIKCPPRSGSTVFNYKGTFRVISFVLVDADYCFRYTDVGGNGRASDSAIFRDSTLNIAMQNNLLDMPEKSVIIGDDAFPLQNNLMKPYSRIALSIAEKIFNYRLSRARRVVENAFGILVWWFRIFLRPIELKLSTVDKVIWAACSLQNWLRMTLPNYFQAQHVDQEDFNTAGDIPGAWRECTVGLQSVAHLGGNNYQREAENVRRAYTEYFMQEGSLPWQWKKVGIDEPC